MPLVEAPSNEAFRANLKAELAAGKPLRQALGIAYSVKRKAAKCPHCGQSMPDKEAKGR